MESWFDEQVKSRKRADEELFQESFLEIAGAIIGTRIARVLEDQVITESAIEEILKYFKIKFVKGVLIPEALKTVDEKINFRLKPYGILHREVKLDKGWHKSCVGPMLGTLKESGELVALIPNKFGGYSFINFSTGKKIRVTSKTENLLDETATLFYKPLPLKKLKIIDLLLFMKSLLSWGDIVLYLSMLLAITLLGTLSPFFNKWLFGTVLESGDIKMLVSLGIFMVSFSVATLCLNTFKSLIYERIGVKMNIGVQSAIMNRVISLPASFFKQYSSGELSARCSYVQSLCQNLLTTIGSTGLTSVFSLIYIGTIFSFAPSLVLPSLGIILLTMIVSLALTFVETKRSKEMMEVSSVESGITYAMFAGIQKIKLAGAEKRMFGRWAHYYKDSAKLSYNPPFFIKYGVIITTAISTLSNILIYWIALANDIGVANYYAFTSAYGLVMSAFMSLSSIFTSVANIKPTLELSKPIMEAIPENAEGKEIVSSLSGEIELTNLSFRYDENSPLVLNNLNLKIRPGEYVGIVGKTGCGKSTLLRLLLGFETPTKGGIYYDKKDISSLELHSLRKHMGTVMQNGKLFLADIFSNIIISCPDKTLDDAWEAARIASVDKDIEEMPMGMNTIISEGQGGISGGQKQRLMIARAVVSKPKILFFDEATSALDNITQKNVSDAIDKLECTRVVIAHRLSTIKNCDRIVVIDEGTIVEDGKYDDLIAKNGVFADLVERQRLELEEENL